MFSNLLSRRTAMTINNSLDQVKRQFEKWRANPNRDRKIPDTLWKQVAPLLTQYKKSEILKTLGVNHQQLKSHLPAAMNKNAISVVKRAHIIKKHDRFISFELPSQAIDNGYQLEVQRLDGTVLRLRHVNPHTLDNLLTSFLG